eukprot:jgi/Tetstr1/449322/TSEL_003837.t1
MGWRGQHIALAALALLGSVVADAAAQPSQTVCQLSTDCETYTPFPVNLRWTKSAQFAGFYAAKALGFWEDECLSVALRPVATPDSQQPAELWSSAPDTRAVLPWYKTHLVQVNALQKDAFHVSQYFRRSALRWWTSPTNDPSKTANMTRYGNLQDVVQCSWYWPRIDAAEHSMLQKYNKTACNFEDPLTGAFIRCAGGESIRFTTCGPGVDEILGRNIPSGAEAPHIMGGMVYDQLGTMLSTVRDGRLYKEGVDFHVFPLQNDMFHMEDGISVSKSWLEEPGSEETMVRFLKGLHHGWIVCRDQPEWCAQLISPPGFGQREQLHQSYMMHEVNKLIWPAPGGIGIHQQEQLEYMQESALRYGLINTTVPISQHTSDSYARLANERLKLSGHDVEGAYFSQPQFQLRYRFCLDNDTLPTFCHTITNSSTQASPLPMGAAVGVIVSAVFLVVFLMAFSVYVHERRKRLAGEQDITMRRNPPGTNGDRRPVTIVVTDIESSTTLWAAYPEAMMEAHALHDRCLRQCLHECFGYEVHTEGDSFTVAFHEAEDALRWCSMVQTSLHSLEWPPDIAAGPLTPPCTDASIGVTADRSTHSLQMPASAASAPTSAPTTRGSFFSAWISGQISSPMQWDAEAAGRSKSSPEAMPRSESKQNSQMEQSQPQKRRTCAEMPDLIEFCDQMAEAGNRAAKLRRSSGENKSSLGLSRMALQKTKQKTNISHCPDMSECFTGLRVRMGIHTGPAANIRRHAVTNRVMYDDHLVQRAILVSDAACGGQVLLTSAVIAEIDISQTAAHAYLLHMGCHTLVGATRSMDAGAMMSEIRGAGAQAERGVELFMLIPRPLIKRVFFFPELITEAQLGAGYFQAPKKENVTICFTAIQHLQEMVQLHPEAADVAIELVCQCVRGLLLRFEGYECEEHKGSFLLAFPTPVVAMKWSGALQNAMLDLRWPAEILEMPGCETLQVDNQVVFKGPRVKVAFRAGSALIKEPHPSTGRADYFGPLLNQAARILSKAAGGQVLVDGDTWAAIQVELAARDPSCPFTGAVLGEFKFKGIRLPVSLFQVAEKGGPAWKRPFPVMHTDGTSSCIMSSLETMSSFVEDWPEPFSARRPSGDGETQPGSMAPAAVYEEIQH